jgi:hypothetical protein
MDDWEHRVRCGDGHAWGGLVLALVTRLETLDIKILSSPGVHQLGHYEVERCDGDPADKLFGYISDTAAPEHTLPLNLSRIPALKNLRSLDFYGRELDMSWCLLPNLARFRVGHDCQRPNLGLGYLKYPHFTAKSNNPFLENALGTELLRPGTLDDCSALDAAFHSSDHLPRLRSLYIIFDNFHYDHDYDNDPDNFIDEEEDQGPVQRILTETNEGQFDRITGRLIAISPKLHEFEVGYYSETSVNYLACTAPVTTFLSFECLTSLSLPQELLLDRGYGTQLQDHVPVAIASLQPPSLERITFYFPPVGVLRWLEELLEHGWDHLLNLEIINLDCDNIRGDVYPLVDVISTVWLSERDVWFRLYVNWQVEDEHSSWWNGTWSLDCDPYVMLVVRWLNELHDVAVSAVVELLDSL